MDTLYEYYDTGDAAAGDIYDVAWQFQSFTPTISHKITSVAMLVYKFVGTSPGTMTVGIRTTSGGVPTGNDLCSGTTNADTLTTDSAGEWREIVFSSSATLIAGTKYAIVARTGSNAANSVRWRFDITGNYSGGAMGYSIDSGNTWIATPPLTGYDFMFREYGILTTGSEINIGDVFKNVESMQINIGGWKDVVSVFINVGGWKTVF